MGVGGAVQSLAPTAQQLREVNCMLWYEVMVYGVSVASMLVSAGVGVLAYRYFREH